MLKTLMVGLMLAIPTVATAQTAVCRALSDAEAQRTTPEADESLVRDSTIECKVGETTVQTRFRVIDKRGATYDCEIRAKGERRYCWYGG